MGCVKERIEEFKLTLELVHGLKSLSDRQFSTDNEKAIKIEDKYKKGLHKEPRFQSMGLRNLVRRESGIVKFAVSYFSN